MVNAYLVLVLEAMVLCSFNFLKALLLTKPQDRCMSPAGICMLFKFSMPTCHFLIHLDLGVQDKDGLSILSIWLLIVEGLFM